MDKIQEVIDEIIEEPYTMAFCYNCGTENQDAEENDICKNCGEKISLSINELKGKIKRYCRECGEQINESEDYCLACGMDIELSTEDLLCMVLLELIEEEDRKDALEFGKNLLEYLEGHYQRFVASGFMKSIYGELFVEKFGNSSPDLTFAQIPDSELNDDIFASILEYSQITIEEFNQLPSKRKQILEKFPLRRKMIQDMKTICYEGPIELAKRGLTNKSNNPQATKKTYKYSSHGSFQGSKGILILWGSLTLISLICLIAGLGGLFSMILFGAITYYYWKSKTI
ncbi:MAG: zinc ribbon domain-containing protein [Candidatus Stygibacter australis]|nr:zinc ribbon domain-containing protein [Candidatus Stygibacter australis]